MARVLVSAVPHTGHVRPLLHVAEALVARGHEVSCYVGSSFESAVRDRGARNLPMIDGLDYDESTVERVFGVRPKNPVRRVAHDIAQMFVGTAPAYLSDLRHHVRDWRPDVVVSDDAHLPSALLAELEGMPYVLVGIQVVIATDPLVPPFGPGLPPATNALAKLGLGIVRRATAALVTGEGERLLRRIRSDLGLPRFDGTFFDYPVSVSSAYLQGCAPEFEYPRSRPPRQLEFVGPIMRAPASPSRMEPADLPSWWPELVAAKGRGRPVVVVTQGTVAVDPENLILPTLRGLAGDDVFVVATATGLGARDLEADVRAPGGGPAKASFRVEDFVPFDELLPFADVLITNGGYGGVQQALSYGVPLVASGVTEDKREVGARVGWSGVGVALQRQRPRPRDVAEAVRTVLSEPSYAATAGNVMRSGRDCGGLGRVVQVIEGLAAN